MNDRSPVTASGHARLSEELRLLREEERPRLRKALEEARALGDLSENAEYHSARERQGIIEAQIRDLEAVLGNAEILDPADFSGAEIRFGATVHLVDEDTEEEVTYQIVGEAEADIKSGRISVTSPVSRAMIGRKKGNSIEVKAPGGKRSYEILAVEWKS